MAKSIQIEAFLDGFQGVYMALRLDGAARFHGGQAAAQLRARRGPRRVRLTRPHELAFLGLRENSSKTTIRQPKTAEKQLFSSCFKVFF